MQTDPIADGLTRIRNASNAGHEEVRVPASSLLSELVRLLHAEGYIRGFQREESEEKAGQPHLRIQLKYLEDKTPIIQGLERVSRPGMRQYVGKREIPRVQGGMGVALLTTPKGVMADQKARKLGVGGELLCKVW